MSLFPISPIKLDNKPYSISRGPRGRGRHSDAMREQAASVFRGKSGGCGHGSSSEGRTLLSFFWVLGMLFNTSMQRRLWSRLLNCPHPVFPRRTLVYSLQMPEQLFCLLVHSYYCHSSPPLHAQRSQLNYLKTVSVTGCLRMCSITCH